MALAPKAQVGVMFEAEVWEGLTAIVKELRDQRKVRASRNALLIALLVRGLPVDERAALDLVGRYDLLAAVLGLPVAFAGIQAGLEGWPLTLLVLPVMFIASLVDRDGFYGHR